MHKNMMMIIVIHEKPAIARRSGNLDINLTSPIGIEKPCASLFIEVEQ